MDFKQAEDKFKQLKAKFVAGKLSEAKFKSRLEELMVQDDQGNWWMIGYETERWYRHDGTNWIQANLPLSTTESLEVRKARIASGLCPKCGVKVKPTDKNCPSCHINLEFAISHLDQW